MWRNSSHCDNLENWDNFIASHTAALAQDWINKKRPGFIGKNEKYCCVGYFLLLVDTMLRVRSEKFLDETLISLTA